MTPECTEPVMNEARCAGSSERSLRAPAGGIGFGVLRDELELAAGDAAPVVDQLGGGERSLVVPVAPGGEAAGQLAVMADHDRAARLREGRHVAREADVGRAAAPPASAVSRKLRRVNCRSSLRFRESDFGSTLVMTETPFEDLEGNAEIAVNDRLDRLAASLGVASWTIGAALHEVDAVGETQRRAQVLLDDQHGDAAPRDLGDLVADLATSFGMMPSVGSSSMMSDGFMTQAARDGQHLLLAARQRAGRLLEALLEAGKPAEHVLDLRSTGNRCNSRPGLRRSTWNNLKGNTLRSRSGHRPIAAARIPWRCCRRCSCTASWPRTASPAHCRCSVRSPSSSPCPGRSSCLSSLPVRVWAWPPSRTQRPAHRRPMPSKVSSYAPCCRASTKLYRSLTCKENT